jgi:hypothetical protein
MKTKIKVKTKIKSVTLTKKFGATTGKPNLLKSKLDIVTTNNLHLPEGTASESKTWSFLPEPWVIKSTNGQTLLTISHQFFTIVRASLSTGGYRCYMTLSFDWTTGWGRTHYSDNPGIHLMFDVKNAQGGLLLSWDLGITHNECGWVNRPISFSRDFNPDIYDIIGDGKITMFGARFFQCV